MNVSTLSPSLLVGLEFGTNSFTIFTFYKSIFLVKCHSSIFSRHIDGLITIFVRGTYRSAHPPRSREGYVTFLWRSMIVRYISILLVETFLQKRQLKKRGRTGCTLGTISKSIT